MRYFLSGDAALKWLEALSVYHVKRDELYELDNDSFGFLKSCASEGGCEGGDSNFIDYSLKEGILTKDKVASRQPVLIKSPEPSLRYLELQITNNCNLKCKHCYIGDENNSTLPQPLPSREGCASLHTSQEGISPPPRWERVRVRGGKNELSVEQIRSILKEFEEMQGLRVLITGGEPLMHGNIEEINEMLPEFLVRKVLFTNGLLLNKKILRKLNVDEIQVSIDGLEYAHDSLRGKGAFRSAIGAVKKALDTSFEVSVATMVHPVNLDDFDGMERLFKEMGIKDWTVDIPCITGRLEKHTELQITPEQGGKFLRYGYGAGLHSGAPGFACGLHLAAVMADGRVSKCTFYADNFAGRIEDGLRECWKRIEPIRLDELACDCRYIESCRGGCRYRALLLGNALGKDLYRCALYDILNKEEKCEQEVKIPL